MSFTEPIIPNPDWGNPFPSVIPDWDDDDDDDWYFNRNRNYDCFNWFTSHNDDHVEREHLFNEEG